MCRSVIYSWLLARFEPTTGSVNWGRVAAVNVSKLERKGDLQTLKQFLPDVAVGKIDGDDIDASPGLINAFRLAQLQAQYVLSCHQVNNNGWLSGDVMHSPHKKKCTRAKFF